MFYQCFSNAARIPRSQNFTIWFAANSQVMQTKTLCTSNPLGELFRDNTQQSLTFNNLRILVLKIIVNELEFILFFWDMVIVNIINLICFTIASVLVRSRPYQHKVFCLHECTLLLCYEIEFFIFPPRNWKAAIKSISPLILLGLGRLVFTTGVDYQVGDLFLVLFGLKL